MEPRSGGTHGNTNKKTVPEGGEPFRLSISAYNLSLGNFPKMLRAKARPCFSFSFPGASRERKRKKAKVTLFLMLFFSKSRGRALWTADGLALDANIRIKSPPT